MKFIYDKIKSAEAIFSRFVKKIKQIIKSYIQKITFKVTLLLTFTLVFGWFTFFYRHISWYYLIFNAISWVLIPGLFLEDFLIQKHTKAYYINLQDVIVSYCLPFVTATQISILWITNQQILIWGSLIIALILLSYFINSKKFLFLSSLSLSLALLTVTLLSYLSNSNIRPILLQDLKALFLYNSICLFCSLFIIYLLKFFIKSNHTAEIHLTKQLHSYIKNLISQHQYPAEQLLQELTRLSITGSNKVNKDKIYTINRELYKRLITLILNKQKLNQKIINHIRLVNIALKANFDKLNDITIQNANIFIQQALKDYIFYGKQQTNIQLLVKRDFPIKFSPFLFNYLITSLLDYAYKNSGDDIKIDITVQTQAIYIKDNGKGLTKKKLDTIFHDIGTEKDKLTLGLSLCKKVVQHFNGNIICHSLSNVNQENEIKEGTYTEFIITFPEAKNNANPLYSRQETDVE